MTDLPTLARIEGILLRLRLVEPEDAEYIFGLRTDPSYNAHLSKTTGTVEDQKQWIVSYKSREAQGSEFYYIIERIDRQRCGVVRLYDIDYNNGTFTWGSWILDHNKPPKAALESALLSFGVGFELLDLPAAKLDVRRSNTHAEQFYRRFGATETHADEENIYFTLARDTFLANRDGFRAILTSAAEEQGMKR